MLGRAPEPSRSRVDDNGGDGTFRGIMIRYLGFSDEGGIYGRKADPGGALWAPHRQLARRGWTHAARWWGAPQPPSVSPLVSVYVTAIYGRGFSSRAILRIFSM